MNRIKTTEVPGDLAQGRNITAGGNITAQGNGMIGKNLEVKGWLKVRNIIGACKGLFSSVEKLNSEYPKPHNGWWALVGDTIPAAIYEADFGKWVATGKTGGNPIAEIDRVNDLQKAVDDASLLIQSNSDTITKLQTQINTLVGNNASEAIDNFNEVIKFLAGVKDTDTLTALLLKLQESIEVNTAGVEKAEAFSKEHDTMPFDGTVTGVDIQPSTTTTVEDIYYDTISKKFTAKNGEAYYSDWKTDNSDADWYMDTTRANVLKDKLYIYNGKTWVWSEEADELVCVNDSELKALETKIEELTTSRRENIVLSEQEYEALDNKKADTLYLVYEDE